MSPFLRARLPERAGRRTNLGLLGLSLAAGGTGVLAFGVGAPGPARWVVAAHGAAGLGLLLLVPWKSVVVRRAARRPLVARAPVGAWALAGLAVLTLLTGVLHSAGATGPWPATAGLPVLHLHVGLAVATLVALVAHARGRRQRPRRTDLSRRSLLRTSALVAGAAAVWGAGEGLLRLTGAPGAERRVTGSFERGTDDPAAMPVTQWFTDAVPAVDHDAVAIAGGGRVVRVPVADLAGDDAVRAALDCTGGWYAVQTWRGTRLDRVLAQHLGDVRLPDDGSIEVVSVTGYRRRLPLRDAADLLLATSAAGRPLSAGHGAPVRLVAPGRRGFWWVKWVARIEVVDAPSWAQPPFPLQ
ncbi:molybdopterin-dependent oxidoreductase [Geodermatophilus sp. YIM 151500]|uniref:molybdopterin-dependent oxidoreductase n=1 Tax=Geodermatophilus sp. YIM 151500 TaxID=2984531 RepID=UPI0021E3B162|nr:molybdopterin-dependent oxidoreductase [Geodermatophilus sp. YIM 151500]MCV2491710.1 molybdopterin-dependent oxidoreductase [Geodermatophilus sp. YIM 151500]